MLTKKDRKKRYNKKTHSLKGHEFSALSEQMTKDTIAAFKGDNLGGAIGGLVTAATGAVKAGIDNAKLKGVEEAQENIDKVQNFQSTANTNDDLLAEMAGAVDTKSNYTTKDLMQDGKTIAMNTINATLQGAAGGAGAGPWGAVAGTGAGLIGGLVGWGVGALKARKKKDDLNTKAKQANLAQAQNLTAKAGALDQAADARALAAYAAYGGGINVPKFSDFPSEVTEFNTGGTHEENPYDGIPQGIAPDGLPNLVEEGEVKYDNYIFSDRLMLTKNDKKKYKFLKGKTYADAAKAIKRELGIDERPNDLIAKTDLEEQLNILSTLQEEERAKRGLRGENRMMYPYGGDVDFAGADSGDGIDLENGEDGIDIEPKTSTFSSLLQLAPILGNTIGVVTQAFNTPKYEHAKELQNGENTNITPITYTPLTQKMAYKPMDVNYYGNKLGAQAGATRRAIREQTASNPYASTAALLSADANAQGQLGDLYKKAEEYNLAQREKVDTFNRATDSANAEMSMKAQQLNASLKDSRAKRQLERDSLAARLKMMEDQAWNESMYSNMTNMFNNLGDIAKQIMAKDMANDYIKGQIRANGFEKGGKIPTKCYRKNKKGFTV